MDAVIGNPSFSKWHFDVEWAKVVVVVVVEVKLRHSACCKPNVETYCTSRHVQNNLLYFLFFPLNSIIGISQANENSNSFFIPGSIVNFVHNAIPISDAFSSFLPKKSIILVNNKISACLQTHTMLQCSKSAQHY